MTTAVNVNEALELVKARLTRLGQAPLDNYLRMRIEAAADDLEGSGIHLQNTAADLMLVVDQTCWDYANRDKQEGMPNWLRLRRRERWLRERRGEEGT